MDIPKILYSGTNKKYLEKMLRIYEYYPNPYMTEDYLLAIDFACKRAKQFDSTPVFLIINTGGLDIILLGGGIYRCKKLYQDNYKIYEGLDKSKRWMDYIDDLTILEEIKRISWAIDKIEGIETI